MNKYPIGFKVKHDGEVYEVIDFRELANGFLYDLSNGEEELSIQEEGLVEWVEDGDSEDDAEIYIVTAVGVGIDTEVRLAHDEDEAKDIAAEIFSEFKVDAKEADEMCYNCWKGYSERACCDVEVEIHRKTLDKWFRDVV